MKTLPIIAALALAAACAPPPPPPPPPPAQPPADAVELVDTVWARHPNLRATLLAQQHRFEKLPEGELWDTPVTVIFEVRDGHTSATITWDTSQLPLARSGGTNRWIVMSNVAIAGAAVLANIKWPNAGSPPDWPSSAPPIDHCIANYVVFDQGAPISGSITFCDEPLRNQAWAALTS